MGILLKASTSLSCSRLRFADYEGAAEDGEARDAAQGRRANPDRGEQIYVAYM